MDMSARSKLIDQLVARGQVDDAIREYIELADIYYRLAELDMARKTYTNALRFVQQLLADRGPSSSSSADPAAARTTSFRSAGSASQILRWMTISDTVLGSCQGLP